MLTPIPAPLPTLTLAALLPIVEVLRGYAQDRLHQPPRRGGYDDDAAARNAAASEASLTLLLDYVLAPLLAPPSTVHVTEQLQLAVRVLATLMQSATPLDQAVPQIRVTPGRRCLLPSRAAATLVQVTLAVLGTALRDAALFLVVALPQPRDGALVVEVEADVAGLAGEDDEARCVRGQLVGYLAAVGGVLTTTRRPEGSLVVIRLPLPAAQGA
jgi:hypothetical protein